MSSEGESGSGLMTAPPPTPAYPQDNVSMLQKVGDLAEFYSRYDKLSF